MLQYAVDVLQVQHVIVCGHYGCGGVRAALERRKLGFIDNWLRHVQDVRTRYDAMLRQAPPDGQADRLCELNVIEQASHVAQTTIVQDAWARGQRLAVHGLLYSLQDGLLRDLGLSVTGPDALQEVVERAASALARR